MERSMLARCVTCLLTANVSFFTSLRLCPLLLPDKNRIIMDVPKDSLVNTYDKLSSRFSQRDLGIDNSVQSLNGIQVHLVPGCVCSQWEWQDLKLSKGVSFLFVTVHSCLFLRLFCLYAWFAKSKVALTFKSHLIHLKQNWWATRVKAPSTQIYSQRKARHQMKKMVWKKWRGSTWVCSWRRKKRTYYQDKLETFFW